MSQPQVQPSDRWLNAAFASLMEQLAGSADAELTLGADDVEGVDQPLLEFLAAHGLARPDKPASTVICDGCERSCSMQVVFNQASGRRSAQCVVQCDKRDDIGQVAVGTARLLRWRFSMEAIAALLATSLKTNRNPQREARRRCWNLGKIVHGARSIAVTLAATVNEISQPSGFRIVLGGGHAPSSGSVVAAGQLLEFQGGQPVIRTDTLEQALGNRIDDGRVACEIQFVRGDVLLFNHITGKQRVLASPNFDSTNDNVFQHLYEHTGQVFTLGELRSAARTPGLNDLHKIAEALRFDGDLKKLFFRISKGSIVFDRTVSVGQLVTLGIDPKSIV